MKKIYQIPLIDSSVNYLNPLCVGIVGSTEASEGNLVKEREYEDEEEDSAMIQLLKDTEEGNTSNLW